MRGGAEKIGDILREYFEISGISRINTKKNLAKKWNEIVGEKFGNTTAVLGVKSNTLHVKVTDSSTFYELNSFKKKEILAKIKSEFPELKINDIKFRSFA